MAGTYLILDGIQDPATAHKLSKTWTHAGIDNKIDPAAQYAQLSIAGKPLTDPEAQNAAWIARHFGLEPRDRAGKAYHPDNQLDELRDKTAYEYRCRVATALVFGLPALVLHYMAPILAGGPTSSRSLFYPWLFETLLVGWMSIAAGWPILWQGALALRYRRVTADLLTTLMILISFIPSAIGTLWLITGRGTWLGDTGSTGPAFHATAYVTLLAVTQRWLMHQRSPQLAGRVHDMIPGYHKLVAAWIVIALIVGMVGGWHLGIAFAMLLPVMASSGAINPWTPGWLSVLPVFGFAGLFLLAPRALAIPTQGVQIEIAAGFAAIMTVTYAVGWKHCKTIDPA